MILSSLKPPLSFPTLTGSIVTFNSQYAMPLKSHKIALTATQSGSGTPSPDNVRPINGYSVIGVSATGLNLWGGKCMLHSFQKMNLLVFSYDDEVVNYSAYSMSGYKTIISNCFKANTRYTLILVGKKDSASTSANISVLYTDNTRENLYFAETATEKQTLIYTSIANKTIKAITGQNGSGVTTLYYNECALLEGVKTADDFVPFGTYTTIQIGSTVYGGEYDARTGVLTATKASVILDSSNVPTSEAYVQYNSATDVYSWTYDNILVGVTNQASVICDKLSLSADAYNRTSGGKFYCTGGLGERIYVSMEGSVVGSKAGMIQWLRDNTPLFVYELGTPTTIQLPPCPIDTLEGVNNIWADTGDTTLQYPKFG